MSTKDRLDVRYVIDAEGSIRETENVSEVLDCLAKDSLRVVDATRTLPGVVVSTVFVHFDLSAGLAEHPVLFETLVFGGPLDGKGERYCTKAEAKIGHKRWVTKTWMHGIGTA